jgi:hypothetical protein
MPSDLRSGHHVRLADLGYPCYVPEGLELLLLGRGIETPRWQPRGAAQVVQVEGAEIVHSHQLPSDFFTVRKELTRERLTAGWSHPPPAA